MENLDPNAIGIILNFILSIPVVGPYIPIVTFVISTAAGLAAILPQGTAGGWWAKIRKILLDLPGLNIGNAKNQPK